MKKLIATLLITLFTITSSAAFAGHHEDGEGKMHKKGNHHQKMFDKFDSDNNGTLSLEEMLVPVKERFAKMDSDGDGEVSRDEAKEYKKAMKEKWKERKAEKREDESDSVEDDEE